MEASVPIPYKLLLFLSLLSISSLPAFSTDFAVGGDGEWAIPSKDPDFYNKWASDNRFKVDDTVSKSSSFKLNQIFYL